MNNLESGLYLPIRFYMASTEQDRYKRHSLGVSLTELNYPYVDCKSLAPFQINNNSEAYAVSVEVKLICADTNEVVTLPYWDDQWHEFINSDGMYYLSYLGTSDWSASILTNGLFYLQVAITYATETLTYYSDLFMIANCNETGYDTTEYRTTNANLTTDLRAVDITDLRIIKN